MIKKDNAVAEFSQAYTDLGKKKLLGKDTSKEVAKLEESVRKMAENGTVSLAEFDFGSQESFLKSVDAFVQKLMTE